MRRFRMIAWREFIAYVRTPGFWLLILLLPVGGTVATMAPRLVARSTPPPNLVVVDFSGQSLQPAIAQALERGSAGRPAAVVAPAPGGPYANTAAATAGLQPYLRGTRPLPSGGRLDAAAIIRPSGENLAIDFWTRDVREDTLERGVAGAVAENQRRARLEEAGVDPAILASIDSLAPQMAEFSPKATNSGKIAFRDRLPGFLGFAIGLLLWLSIISGAGMLLNSVMEEKSSRVLEILLSSASVPEIMAGKIVGVAAVTFSIMALWLGVGGVILALRWPAIGADVVAILIGRGLLAYFALYLATGYLMFATLFVGIGAVCETQREAQMFVSPIMILMSVPMVAMGQAISQPDSPLLQILTWIPPFTPFMMAARAASSPPAWEIAATTALLLTVIGVELWFAVPAFKSGALATGRLNLRSLFSRERA